ncbi:hypothetical protein FB565_007513 [Actinoplanes lutulentus]|uniref:hypothetical protein n=1 Tax=Actinoplanes lutulentus TaxID=1287878 RepID=UPI0015EB4A84|nr:hypothetical protein [Actinoplanes lutulentus]MBB2947742.1 hypothetical protein [Actinoplanes lutulentus]
MTVDGSPLVSDKWPRLAAALTAALCDLGEGGLAGQVAGLRALQDCGCGEDFCQSFYTQPPPDGAYGPGHRNVNLDQPCMIVLDMVDDVIMFVEVIDGRDLLR